MSNVTNEKHGCMRMMHGWSIANFRQDTGSNKFRFSLKQHGPSHLVKVKLEKTGASTIPNLFGSSQSNDVSRFIFCPNFCKMVISILQLDLMNLFLKAWAWFNPITHGMTILIANTLTTFHRDEWLEHTYAMHGKCNYDIEMPKETWLPS